MHYEINYAKNNKNQMSTQGILNHTLKHGIAFTNQEHSTGYHTHGTRHSKYKSKTPLAKWQFNGLFFFGGKCVFFYFSIIKCRFHLHFYG